jgi:hypothetical protein
MSAEQETSRIGAGGTIVVRTLHDSDQVLAAPGRGIEPAISAHMATTPSLYNLDSQPVEQVSPLIQR